MHARLDGTLRALTTLADDEANADKPPASAILQMRLTLEQLQPQLPRNGVEDIPGIDLPDGVPMPLTPAVEICRDAYTSYTEWERAGAALTVSRSFNAQVE